MTHRRTRGMVGALLGVALLLAPLSAASAAVAPEPTPTGVIGDDPEHSGPTETAVREAWPDGETPSSPHARRAAPMPAWQLPFDSGQSWASGGPHSDSDSGGVRGSLDFAPQGANNRVVAVAEGRVYRLTCSNGWFLGIDHGNGWRSEYYHLEGARESLIGEWVAAGAYLGEAGNAIPCGGRSNGAHVHLSLLHGDDPRSGPRPYYPIGGVTFSGYTARQGARDDQGRWEDASGRVVFTNWGCCLTSAPSPVADVDPTGAFQRLAGVDRYGTAAAISAATFASGVDVAYVATGNDFPDALSAAAIASAQRAPVLLTQTDALPAATADELRRLTPRRIIVLGGDTRISDAVVAALGGYTAGTVERIAGVNRYETATLLSRAAYPTQVPVVYLATGETFPDALSAAAVAGRQGGPVLLTPRDALPDAVAAEIVRLQPARVVIMGGEDRVSTEILQSLRGLVPEVSRVAGANRFQTAALLSSLTMPRPAPAVFLTNGENFPDALAGAAAAAAASSPVLLTTPLVLPDATAREISRMAPAQVVALGSGRSVSAGVVRGALNLVR